MKRTGSPLSVAAISVALLLGALASSCTGHRHRGSPRQQFELIGSAAFWDPAAKVEHEEDPEGLGQLLGDRAEPLFEAEAEPEQSAAVVLAPDAAVVYKSLISPQQLQRLVPQGPDRGDGPSGRVPAEGREMYPVLPASHVIGSDDRTRRSNTTDYPWRAMGWVESDQEKCTGTQIGPRHVLTSAHCVVRDQKWFTNIRYYPGRNGSSSPYGSKSAFCVVVTSGWFDHEYANHDYAMIILPQDNSNGWLGYADRPWSDLKNSSVWMFGYPTSKSPFPSLWGMSCTLEKVYTHSIRHECDATGGQSGAPLYHYNGGDRRVVAVHKGKISDWHRGPRINNREFDNLWHWKYHWFGCASGCCAGSPSGCCP